MTETNDVIIEVSETNVRGALAMLEAVDAQLDTVQRATMIASLESRGDRQTWNTFYAMRSNVRAVIAALAVMTVPPPLELEEITDGEVIEDDQDWAADGRVMSAKQAKMLEAFKDGGGVTGDVPFYDRGGELRRPE